MRKLILIFTALSILSVVFGCSSTSKLTKINERPAATTSEKTDIINENFDPSLLEEHELKLKKTISPESKSDDIEALLLQPTENTELPEELDGFRVQICAVSDDTKGMQVRRDARIQFINEDVYMDYHAHYYKVRIGNCVTRYEAEKLQQMAIENWCDEASVVRTKVKPNDKKPKTP